jgi:hypothetical protein
MVVPNRRARRIEAARQPKAARVRIDIRQPIESQPAYMSQADVAALLGNTVRTIARWEQLGLIRVIRPCGGNPLIARSEVERLLSEGAR